MHWNEIIRTLMASPKSYHSSLWRSTLKEAFFSALKGDLYHTLFPRCITGSYPNPAKKSTSLMSFASCMFITSHFHGFGQRTALSLKHEKQWHQMSSEIIRWHRASSIDMIYMKNGYREYYTVFLWINRRILPVIRKIIVFL